MSDEELHNGLGEMLSNVLPKTPLIMAYHHQESGKMHVMSNIDGTGPANFLKVTHGLVDEDDVESINQELQDVFLGLGMKQFTLPPEGAFDHIAEELDKVDDILYLFTTIDPSSGEVTSVHNIPDEDGDGFFKYFVSKVVGIAQESKFEPIQLAETLQQLGGK
jgi:hypothetical protein